MSQITLQTLPLDPVGPAPAASPALRWGILAPGTIAARFARDVLAHTASTIAAVGSRSLPRAQAFAERFTIPRPYGSYEELLADDDVDAVYIASPHSHHREHALEAIRAGKPALVEKAFTRSAAEAEEVFAAAQSAGVFVMEAMWTRFLPQYYTLRALLARGVIGNIVHVYAAHGQAIWEVPRLARPELAGGSLLDLGVYPVSFAHHILGRPTAVQAAGHMSPAGVDETVGMMLTYPGAMASLSSTMLSRSHNIAEISGTTGRITMSDMFYHPGTSITVHPADGEPYVYSSAIEGGFQFEAAEVARSIHASVLESPLMPWQETLEVMRTLDEVRRQLGMVFPGEAS